MLSLPLCMILPIIQFIGILGLNIKQSTKNVGIICDDERIKKQVKSNRLNLNLQLFNDITW